ncbi:MAG TPA: hypothetical protein VEM32_03695 [Geobacteraceae bacterium]|nr:hypothetical protein [Geobacteraceae bacterium]
MRTFRTSVLCLTTIIAVGAENIAAHAQPVSASRQSPSMVVSIAMQKDRVLVGRAPWVVLTAKNITDREVPFRTSLSAFHPYVEAEKGEAPKTELHRHLRGDFRPGDHPDLAGGDQAIREIAPSGSTVQTIELTPYYDFTKPGKYSVYLEVYDQSTKLWVRTNTVQFEIQAPPQ